MAILAECPVCRRKQGRGNKFCLSCGKDLKKAKVRYWISYYLPDGKQRRELVGTSIKEARQAEGKRMGQKKENRFSWDMLVGNDMTFRQLTDWYLDLPKVKELASYNGAKIRLNNFNEVYGDRLLKNIKPIDLENYQHIRSSNGIKNITIDNEMVLVKTVIRKAWENDMVNGNILKAFQNVKKLSKKTERSRDRVITIAEYLNLIDHASAIERCKMVLGMHTGMRPGEIKKLQWSFIDRKTGFIRLPEGYSKKNEEKRIIPINHYVNEALEGIIRRIDSDYVFNYAGKPPSRYTGAFRGFRTACTKAGIPCGKSEPNGITPHDFRRTFKTNCVSAGVDPAWRNALCGHSQEGMDEHYIKPGEEDLKLAMERYTSWFDVKVSEISDQTSDQII